MIRMLAAIAPDGQGFCPLLTAVRHKNVPLRAYSRDCMEGNYSELSVTPISDGR